MNNLRVILLLALTLTVQCTVFQRRNGNGGTSPDEALAKVEIAGYLPNTIRGTLYFNLVERRGLVISGEIEGLLPESTYAMHIMDGTCDSGSEMSDFDPGNAQKHGQPWLSPTQRRAGILPNITADENGKAVVEFDIPCLDVVPGSAFSVLGRSVIIFSGPDNFQTGPAGQKIACGIISATAPEPMQ
ncbi:MAG TPA: superoxide dismutase family protein [Chitinispirillaceae bacterium]|jgi:Cu-Zn family superoxide dismutase|nr:superoxide dismutase family protein [Chitinispirillaceae bacterium]